MAKRFLEKDDLASHELEFVRRSHGVSTWWLGITFASAYVFILIFAYFVAPQDTLMIVTFIGGILATLGAIALSYVLKQKDIIEHTEFQNALLAGAARINNQFCIIAKYDGSIVYVAPEFAKRFPQFHGNQLHHINDLLEYTNDVEKERMANALAVGQPAHISLETLTMDKGTKALTLALDPIGIYNANEQGRLMLAVDPLPRPSGYFFIRAKEDSIAQFSSQALLADFPIGYFVLNDKRVITECNEGFAAMLGLSVEDIIEGEYAFESFASHPEQALELFSSHDDQHTTIILQNKDGYETANIVSLHVLTNKEGEVLEYHGLTVEIIGNDSPNELLTNAAELVDWLKHSQVATTVLNAEGKIIKGNESFARLLASMGLSPESIDSLTELVVDEDKEGVSQFIQETIDTKIPSSEKPKEIRLRLPDQEASASLFISRVAIKPGVPASYVVHLIDTTDIKNLELRFVHSQKMQAVGQLAGGIAHDFNNLLTAMMGFCDLLLMRHPAGDQSFADIMQIKQNANRAANLVRQLLAFSRKQTLQPKVISITDTLADLSNLIGRLIGENIKLDIVHGRDIGLVRVDQGQLEQVIINLAVNARDAMDSEGELNISTQNFKKDKDTQLDNDLIAPAEDDEIEEGEYVLLKITDTGCGIDKENIGKIFEPFFSTKEVGSGTGLGLSTVYGIIKQTDGYVYVKSAKGKGTSFYIFLKRFKEEEEKKSKNQKKEQAEINMVSEDLTGKGTILLVEDEAPVRAFSASALKNKGYTVLEAESGQEGLEQVKEHGKDIELIISDVIMPGLNGTAMVDEIHKDFPDIPVIFISGYAEDVFDEHNRNRKEFNFLPKPYTLKQLAGKVKEVLSEK